MAKNNLFLGLADGKIGDIVLYRRNGVQCSRTRVRNPRNPRSNAQLYQRAFMATILQAYAAGRAIFDHSFQGKDSPAKNQAEFISRNLRDLRAGVVSESPDARVVAPRSTVPVANAYTVSAGTLPQTPFGRALNTLVGTGMAAGLAMPQPLPGPGEAETLDEYAARVGLVPEDIYTICCFGMNPDEPVSNTDYGTDGTQYMGAFGYLQFKVKQWDATAGAAAIATTKLSVMFEIFANNVNVDDLQDATVTDFSGASQELSIRPVNIVGDGFNYGAIGTIRSRENDGARSKTVLKLVGEDQYGITSEYLLDVWRDDAGALGNSRLILEGSNF